jgi:TorA maturation chaperone TorD
MKNQDQKDTAAMPATADEWHREAVSRSNCYGLLALVFRDVPTAGIVAQLRTTSFVETLSYLGHDITQDLAGELEAVTKRLGEQYTQTFAGPGHHVSLYASVHRGEGQLWGDSTVWVKRFIETTGLSFRNNWDSIPDHIAIELELMQRLTAHEAELRVQVASAPANEDKQNSVRLLQQCLQAQELFLREHLCKWIPQFYERVLEICPGAFYREVAGLTNAIVLSDVEHMAVLLSASPCN